MATANTRATDSDRNDTCRVLDSALRLSDGQLSMEEHRERVSAATNATTLTELQSLVSDLQVHSAPVQVSKLRSQARVRGIWIAAAVVLVLLGLGFGWGLSGNSTSPTKFTSTPSATPNGNGPTAVTTSTAPQHAPVDLLSLGGLSGFFAQMRTQFGDTMGYELGIRSGYAALTRPDAVNAHKTVDWDYRNGRWMSLGPGIIPPTRQWATSASSTCRKSSASGAGRPRPSTSTTPPTPT